MEEKTIIPIDERIKALRQPWPSLIERLTDATEVGTKSASIGLDAIENSDAFPDDIHLYEGVVHKIANLIGEYFNMPQSKFNLIHSFAGARVNGEEYAGALHYKRKK